MFAACGSPRISRLANGLGGCLTLASLTTMTEWNCSGNVDLTHVIQRRAEYVY